MDDEYDEEETEYVNSRQLQIIDPLILGFEFLRGCSSAVTNALASAVALLAAHANYKVEQHEFRTAAAIEIETIVGEGDE